MVLAKLSLTSTADSSFVELLRLTNGVLDHKVEQTRYNLVEDTLARRTFDESGNYAVEGFELDVRESLLSGTNRGIYASGTITANGDETDESLLALGMGQGVAYVKGYELRKHGTTWVDLLKARDYQTASGLTTRFEQLPFINVTNLYGTPDVGFVSGETEVYKKVRLVDTEHGTRGTVFGTSLAHVYDIGRAKTRAFEYNSGTSVSPDSGTTTH